MTVMGTASGQRTKPTSGFPNSGQAGGMNPGPNRKQGPSPEGLLGGGMLSDPGGMNRPGSVGYVTAYGSHRANGIAVINPESQPPPPNIMESLKQVQKEAALKLQQGTSVMQHVIG